MNIQNIQNCERLCQTILNFKCMYFEFTILHHGVRKYHSHEYSPVMDTDNVTKG